MIVILHLLCHRLFTHLGLDLVRPIYLLIYETCLAVYKIRVAEAFGVVEDGDDYRYHAEYFNVFRCRHLHGQGGLFRILQREHAQYLFRLCRIGHRKYKIVFMQCLTLCHLSPKNA